MGRKTLHEFTATEDAILRARSEAGYYDRLIAEELGLPRNVIRNRRVQLGIRKMHRSNTGWNDAPAVRSGTTTMDALVEMEAAYAAFVEAAAAFLEKARKGGNK